METIPNLDASNRSHAGQMVEKQSLLAIAKALEKRVELKNRRYRLKVYSSSFLGYDAVTVLHTILSTTWKEKNYTRKHAEQMGCYLAERFHLFEHVTQDHSLKDDYLMYRFVQPPKRTNWVETNQQDVDATERFLAGLMDGELSLEDDALWADNSGSIRSYDEVRALRRLIESVDSVHNKNSFQSDASMRSFQSSSRSLLVRRIFSSPGSLYKSTKGMQNLLSPRRRPKTLSFKDDEQDSSIEGSIRSMGEDRIDLWEVAEFFERGMFVTTQQWLGKSYPESFVGSEAIDFLISSHLASNRMEAKAIGQAMMAEYNLFEHVTNEEDFKDNYFFYRFTPKEKQTGLIQMQQEDSATLTDSSMETIALDLEKTVGVKDRRYYLRTYQQCFLGRDMVSTLVHLRYAPNRFAAVELGRKLAKRLRLFQHVTEEHELKDDFLFYHFIPKEQRNVKEIDIDEECEVLESDIVTTETETMDLARTFREEMPVKSHKVHFKRYTKTFTGTEAVEFMVNSSMAKCRKHAVILGRRLQEDMAVFDHIKKERTFADDPFLYRFAEDMSDNVSLLSLDGISDGRLEEIAEGMRIHVPVKDRRWYHKLYKNAFLGSEAIDYLVKSGAAGSRESAVIFGRKLTDRYRLFDHVEGDHELKDERLFYSFTPKVSKGVEIDIEELLAIAKQFEEEVTVKDNKWHMRVYPKTFVGDAAVSYLVDAKFSTNREEAVELGHSLASTFNLFEHVSRERRFSDKTYFFRFTPKCQRLMWKAIPPVAEDEVYDPAKIFFIGESTEDLMWKERIEKFEERVSLRRQSTGGQVWLSSKSIRCAVDWKKLDSAAAYQAKLRAWVFHFRRLDPRWRILQFFNEVGQIGAHDIERIPHTLKKVHPLLWFLSRASVFTVWRPTQYNAIRNMMLGKAVGKGLDIKGKSAKRGKLASFVPFLQISDNRHKQVICTLPKSGKIRLFFTSFETRNNATKKLEIVCKEMMETVEGAADIMNDMNLESAERDAAKEVLLWDVEDFSVMFIDDYAPKSYGLEVAARCFWEAFVVRQDISTKHGSQYCTGRPSIPAFQDMTLNALMSRKNRGSRRVVVYQNASSNDSMNPMELLVAYEEHGRVLPVVSDFDALLVGTRRVSFDLNSGALPNDQLDVLKWSINNIRDILDAPPRPESWTNRWLGVLKKANKTGFHPDIPEFGFGDPKSYSLMENAVGRLTASGAVRHGAESFNYYFPQDLDEEFLVVSDKLEPVPWRYMTQRELQEFLKCRISEGFTFPLNPKWILCDPGWKDIYDQLLASDRAEVKQSMQIWYPEESGIREQIERIAERNPNGFQRGIRLD